MSEKKYSLEDLKEMWGSMCRKMGFGVVLHGMYLPSMYGFDVREKLFTTEDIEKMTLDELARAKEQIDSWRKKNASD